MAEASNEVEQNDKRKQFGNRLLTDPKNVFEHNAWDNVVWDEVQENDARSKTEEQLAHPASTEDIEKYEADANKYWNKFYGVHDNKFFKDRHWLFTEFPELAPEFYLSPECLSQITRDVNNTVEIVSSVGNKTAAYSSLSHPGSCAHSDTRVDSTQDLSNNCHSVQTVSQQFSLASLENHSPASLGNGSTASLGNCSTASSDSSAHCISGGMHKNTEVNKPVSSVDECPRRKARFPGEMAKYRMFEVGCGVGNTVFPILQANNDPDLMVYCCDYSSTAIDLVKGNKDYDERRCHAFVCDISEPEATVPFPDESLDVIILIFILSANNPDKFQAIINRLSRFLRPGGMILFRDYGRYDLAQLRFKKGKCLRENFYVRGDGTRVYFFTQDEMREMMGNAGLVEKQNLVDRRLQVNRGKQLKMYRVWIQCKYLKPLPTEANDEQR